MSDYLRKSSNFARHKKFVLFFIGNDIHLGPFRAYYKIIIDSPVLPHSIHLIV